MFGLFFFKKIDLLKCFYIFCVSAVFYMYVSNYLHNCFPNCYAWKEMMIKWCDGEIVRRGLLGTVFYALEPAISIRYSAPFFELYIHYSLCFHYIRLFGKFGFTKVAFIFYHFFSGFDFI